MAFEDNQRFYEGAIKEYGISALGVHWSSKENQYKRFEIITTLINKKLQSHSFADIGCGFGEYYQYLLQNNHENVDYLGIDCEKSMITICKRRFPSLKFLLKNAINDALPQKDYYLCSGALNILNKTEFFVFIHNVYLSSTKAFIFNFLSSDSYNYILKKEVIEFCEDLCPNIEIINDYLDNDSTIIMRR